MDKLCDRETRQEFQVKIAGVYWNLVRLQRDNRKQVVNLPSVLARECEERRKAHTEYLKNT